MNNSTSLKNNEWLQRLCNDGCMLFLFLLDMKYLKSSDV